MKKVEKQEDGICFQHSQNIRSDMSASGITLVALVVTIVVLLILAGITITYVFGNNGVFGKVSEAKLKTNIAKAREKIEMVLSEAKIPKHTDSKYNENEYLDEFILSRISDTEVLDNVIITDGYAFELDRSVPKIGEYVGKRNELVVPEVSTSVTLAQDYRTATITINAKEEKNGISKIEVIQGGYVLKAYTYDNKKELIIEEYTTKCNGTYTIKVYANLTVRKKAEVKGLVSSIIFSPNGNEEYKKEHQVKVSVQDETDKVISLKYQWLQTTVEPKPETFVTICNNSEVITGKDYTGTYYLWILLETEDGKTMTERSEGFSFDNTEPTVTLNSTPVSTAEFKLTVKASDSEAGIEKYEFYIGERLEETKITEGDTITYNYIRGDMGQEECYVKVYDYAGNVRQASTMARTKMYTWERWQIDFDVSYSESSWSEDGDVTLGYNSSKPQVIYKEEPHLYNSERRDWETTTGYSGGILSSKIKQTEAWGSRRKILCTRLECF